MPNVLVVEDDADLAELLARVLRTRGHDIRIAADGKAALAEILHRTPDVVLLDLSMPIMDGPGLLEVLRSYLRFYDLPVIVLTALPPGDPSVAQAEAAGIQGLFFKGSYGVDELLDRVTVLAARRRP